MSQPPPAAAPLGASGAQHLKDAHHTLLADLRSIAEEARNLRDSLASLAANDKTQADDRSVQADVEALTAHVNDEREQVNQRLQRVQRTLDTWPPLANWASDIVTRVENQLDRTFRLWPRKEQSLKSIVAAAEECRALLADTVFEIGRVTIAERVEDHLRAVRVGGSINFHTQFEDELPDENDRRRMLEHLRAHPVGISGVIDVASGQIYRTPATVGGRLLALGLPVIAVGVGFAALWALARIDGWAGISNWPEEFQSFKTLAVTYIFVLLGSVAHVAVGFYKARRSAQSDPVVLGDVVAWLYIHSGSIVVAVVTIVGGLLLASYFSELSWLTAFLLGYSLDSGLDILLKRFETKLTARTLGFQKSLASA